MGRCDKSGSSSANLDEQPPLYEKLPKLKNGTAHTYSLEVASIGWQHYKFFCTARLLQLLKKETWHQLKKHQR